MPIIAMFATALLVQSVPVQKLPAPDARAKEPVSAAFDLEELADGRVVVTDNREKALMLFDLARGTATQLGRNGKGPKEYVNVFTIVRGAGDTLRVADSSLQRYAVITPKGEFVRTEAMPPVLFSLGSYSPVREDSKGRLYMALMELNERRADGSLKIPDHSTLYRYDPGATSLVNLGTIRRFAVEQDRNGVIPFPMRDAWTVAPDGRIAVVSAADYHVEWFNNGRAIAKGPMTAYTRIKVDGNERDTWFDAFKSQPAGSATMTGGDSKEMRGSRDPAVRSRVPDDAFPEFKPPFETEYAPIDPKGRIWITRSARFDDANRMADLFDARGSLVARVALPPHTEIAGFGKSHIFLVRRDDDDLLWIERYALRF